MKNNWLVWGFKFLLIASLLSCSSSSTDSAYRVNETYGLDLNSCSTEIQNEFVHRALQDRYYWYEQIASDVIYSDFSSPEEVLSHLKYDRYDRFSYIESSETQSSFYNEGEYVGFGLAAKLNSDNQLTITFVYKDSPSGNAGLKRGDVIVSVDNIAISNFLRTNSEGKRYLTNPFGSSMLGVVKTLEINRNGVLTTHSLTKAVVTINSVIASETFDYNNKKYAYLMFQNFINPSFNELDDAFSKFKNYSSEKLILDLRYNGGGLLSVANALASYIYQPQTDNSEKFVDIKFNDKYQSEDYTYYFNQLNNSLNLNEVIILTTGNSCSASEMVINSLKPYINVTVIGSATCGKPIGMRRQSFCGKDLVAINFQGFNNAGFGDYFDGINADCSTYDEISHDFGNINEPMLKAALVFDNQSLCISSRPQQSMSNQVRFQYQGLKQVIGAE